MLEERERGVEEVVDLPQVRSSVDKYFAAAQADDRLDGDIAFVHDLTDQLFQNVFQCDEAIDAAVLVDDDPHVNSACLEIEQQPLQREGAGDEERLARQGL